MKLAVSGIASWSLCTFIELGQ